jgi:hypothetical protein
LSRLWLRRRSSRFELDECDEVNGIGVALTGSGYVIRVNLARAPERALPASIAGVPVEYEVIGSIVPFGRRP